MSYCEPVVGEYCLHWKESSRCLIHLRCNKCKGFVCAHMGFFPEANHATSQSLSAMLNLYKAWQTVAFNITITWFWRAIDTCYWPDADTSRPRRIRNLSRPGGLRPSTLPLGHGGSPQYWLSHVDGEETFLFLSNRRDRTPNSGVKGSGANHYPRAPAQIPTRTESVDHTRITEYPPNHLEIFASRSFIPSRQAYRHFRKRF